MSYDTGHRDQQFVHPGEAAPAGSGLPTDSVPTFLHPKTRRPHPRDGRPRRANGTRRVSKIRRAVPVVIALLAAITFITLTDGGSKARQIAPVMSYLGTTLERVGLGLNEVTVKGQRMTRDAEIYARLQLSGHRSIWLLDTDAARQRVETLPWVLKASLKRVFPDRLHVDIQERTPRAIWSDGRQTALIDSTGRLLGTPAPNQTSSLPTIFGAGAAPHAEEILSTVGRIPVLRDQVAVFEWTANRRWTLHLKSGRQILLPGTGRNLALMQLTKGRRGRRLIDSHFAKLDMRVASQTAIEFR